MSKETRRLFGRRVNPEILEFSGLFLGIFFIALTSIYNYLLFHSVAEIFSIIIAGGVFFVGWNSRKYMNNSFFLVLGVSSLFIGIIDLIHTLSFSGMQIFPEFDANLPTSLWIAARYLQSCSLLFASLLIKRSVKSNYLFVAYMGIFIILTIIIFNNAFPVCYIEGIGLTIFKIISEYIINLILFASLLIIIKNRTEFDKKVLFLMISSTLAFMIAELAFTFYIGVSDFSNFLGHIFKIIAFYLLYKSIIQIGIEQPFDLLFRKIKRSELELKNIITHSDAGITMLDEKGMYLLVNEKAAEELGGEPEDFIGKTLFDILPENIAEEHLNNNRELIQNGISRSYQRTFDLPIGEKTYWITEQPLQDIDEKFSSLLSISTDITEKIKADALLKEAEIRYRTTFEQSPDGIVILNPESLKAIEFNDAVCKLLGYTREEFEKFQINDYDIIENPSETKAHVGKVFNDGRDDFETKFRTKNGEIKDVYVTAKLITLSGKKYLQSTFRDITERKKAEKQIKYQAELIENISDAIISTDIDFNIISFNKAAESIYGWAEEEIIGKNIMDTIRVEYPYDEQEAVINTFMEKGVWSGEVIQPRKDGTKINMFSSVNLIRDTEGNPIGAVAINRDITDRKKAEEKILNLSKFPSENPSPVLRVNNELIIYANKIGAILFNVEEGGPIPEILESSINNALNNQEIQDLEVNLNERTYTLVITPVENVDYVNIYGLDITERKQAEERLSHLISTVSHELRTPITVLLMSIEYLTKHKETLTEELEEKLIEGISRNIQLLNQLAEDILLISRIDEHRFELEWKKFKPLDVINEILYLMEPIGKEKQMNFEVDVDNIIELYGDPKRIDQVFRIIIDNAIKYSPKNSNVEIRAIDNYQGKYNVHQNSGTLFQFQDYGRGIPKEDLPKIFERFFRSSNVNEVSGTGLGLSIAKDIIEAHNGKITVESEDEGTLVCVFLPQIERFNKNFKY